MTKAKFLRALQLFSPLYGLEATKRRIHDLRHLLGRQSGSPRGQYQTVRQIEHLEKSVRNIISLQRDWRRAAA